jgi:superfamily II DNA or RNA helicase
MSKIIIADQIYVPKAEVDIRRLRTNYERHMYNEKACVKCDNKPDRFNDVCATCPAYGGLVRTWRKIKIKGKPYYAVPKGNWQQVEKRLRVDLNGKGVRDRRINMPMQYPLRFTGKLFDGTQIINGVQQADQKTIVAEYMRHEAGLIEARPRTGKTAMAVRTITKRKQRVLVLAHERELLKQFMRALRKFTNLREQEAEHSVKIAGIIQKEKDWSEDWDIVLCTYQKFIHPKRGMPRINKHLRRRFGYVIVDEVHRANAATYSRVINYLDTQYVLGLTATVERKDGMQFLVEEIMGPVVARADTEAMLPRVEITDTKITSQYEWRGMSAFTKACQFLSKQQARNVMIVRQIFQDLRENKKHCIVIPVLFVPHARLLVKMINNQARINNEKRGEDWDSQLARLILGVGQQSTKEADESLRLAREGTATRVIVATRKKVAEGTDVPTWTHMYMQFPINNAPQFFQMSQRICTVYEGKPQPVLRFYVDDLGVSLGCFAATWGNGVVAQKYKVKPQIKTMAYEIMARRSKQKTARNKDGQRSLW